MPEKVKRTILVIEDSSTYRKLYKRALGKDSRYQYLVYEAEDTQEGLKYCQTCTLDCILLDLILPGSNGLEFLADLKNHFSQIYWPVIMISDYGDESIAIQAMKLGAQDYLKKGSFSDEVLWRTIDNAIEKASLIREKENSIFELEKQIRQLSEKNHYLEEKLRLNNETLAVPNTQLLDQLAKRAAV